MTTFSARIERWPIAGEFVIARGSKTEAVVVVVEAERDGAVGFGEAVPYARYGESSESVIAQIESTNGVGDRRALLAMLPRGAARSAIDCALFDLECKLTGEHAHEIAGLPAPIARATAHTISIGAPVAMEAAARALGGKPFLKVKLAGDEHDVARIEAVRRGAPGAELWLDPNESWSEARYREVVPIAAALGVTLIEQPFRPALDPLLAILDRPIAVCADEATFGVEDVSTLADRYDAINVKLDKSGGLTTAIDDARRARSAGLGVMIGCMVSTSLSIAPARLLASDADFVDLDGADLLARDRDYRWGEPATR
jgi:L-alanine-DL-glutamate epimerase-like enolase superfamily enzyme